MDWIDKHLPTVIGVITAICALLGISRKQVREWVTYKLTNQQGRQMVELLAAMDELRYEVKPNGGGSLRDAVNDIACSVAKLEARDNYNFRNTQCPTFECTTKGDNLRMSDAYLTLVGVSRSQDLNRMDWAGFVRKDHLEDYVANFQRAARHESDFRDEVGFTNNQGENIGLWRVVGIYMGGVYFGSMKPLDDIAKAICEANEWNC